MDAPGRWLHRWAVVLVCAAWPLIWIGSLVTTVDAGMSVPDWPTTYGYNMFRYPLEWWLTGPFDLLVEHGHRLWASAVGLIAIATAGVAWWREPRRWVVWLATAVLAAVIGQGVLGGMRVVLDMRSLAMLHACIAAAFFALCTALAVVTSRWWWRGGSFSGGADTGPSLAVVHRLTLWTAGILAAVCYIQLVLGAQLRHLQADTSPIAFRHTVEAHVGTALAIWVLSGVLAWRLWKCGDLTLSRPARWLVGLVAVQIMLGVATWVVNYGVLVSTEHWPWAAQYVIQSKGYVESGIVSAHVATGALLVACSVMLWLRTWRAVARTEQVFA